MKKLAILLCLAVLAFGAFAEDLVVAPTQTVVDTLVSLGIDKAALATAQSNAPAGALFLAPGSASKEVIAQIDTLATTEGDSDAIEEMTDPKTILDTVIMGEIIKARPVDYFGVVKMTVGGITWSVDFDAEDD